MISTDVPATHMSSERLADYAIGLKLRALRSAKNFTLARLAAETGLSTGLLSKLETDRMIPTLQTLERICHGYGIDLGHFFSKPQNLSVSITRRTQYENRRGVSNPPPIPLHIPTAQGSLVSQIIELSAGQCSTIGQCGDMSEVAAYVIKGTLHISLGASLETLEQGDTIVVSTDRPILWSADSKSDCRILSVSPRLSAVRAASLPREDTSHVAAS